MSCIKDSQSRKVTKISKAAWKEQKSAELLEKKMILTEAGKENTLKHGDLPAG